MLLQIIHAQAAGPDGWSQLILIVPQVALALVLAAFAREMQIRNAAQIETLLSGAEVARSQQRADFLQALKDEREERRADNTVLVAQVQALAGLVTAGNALMNQYISASRQPNKRAGDTIKENGRS